MCDNQTKPEFNNKKKIIEFDGRSWLPDGVTPAGGIGLCRGKLSKQSDYRLGTEKRKQEVELIDDLSPEHTKGGDFLRINA
ncbi:MAG TPA: hypothetical protein VFX43_19970 [Chitinophagaceae bacterium]|nr:hypothetical protein [Chitinophagaceae bacterium]